MIQICIISLTVMVTALISGVIGMAGGIILMAVYLALLPVSAAMILHGATQIAANGYRAILHRKSIPWSILPPYLLGALVAWGMFRLFAFIPDKGIVYIIIGVFPWLAVLIPKSQVLTIHKPAMAVCAGLIVTCAQILAGASGPLLDVFYRGTDLSRHTVVAGKALTQAIGHLIKLAYYAELVTQADLASLPWWIYPLVAALAISGTRLGAVVLDRITDSQFRRIADWVILGLATLMILQGMRFLLP